MATVTIGPELRTLIRRARTDAVRWHGRSPRQEEIARQAGISGVYYRQLESGYKNQASADALGNICYALRIDPWLLRDIGKGEIADVVDASIRLTRTGSLHFLPDNGMKKKTRQM
jgi:transcriptional regulator with XRE-family HTH domain